MATECRSMSKSTATAMATAWTAGRVATSAARWRKAQQHFGEGGGTAARVFSNSGSGVAAGAAELIV